MRVKFDQGIIEKLRKENKVKQILFRLNQTSKKKTMPDRWDLLSGRWLCKMGGYFSADEGVMMVVWQEHVYSQITHESHAYGNNEAISPGEDGILISKAKIVDRNGAFLARHPTNYIGEPIGEYVSFSDYEEEEQLIQRQKECEAEARKREEAEQLRLIEQVKAQAAKREAEKLQEENRQREIENQQRAQNLAIKQAEAVIAQKAIEEAQAKRAADERWAEAARAKQAEEQRHIEEARQEAAEIERQNEIGSYPLLRHVDAFLRRLDEVPAEDVRGDKENKLFQLYLKVKEVLEKNGKVAVERKEELADDVLRLHQIETVLDLYSEKIRRVRNDEELDDEEREEKIAYWKSLRDRHVADIQGS